ncbi:hypothetical protein GGF32_008567 [Allomyces javanicus]|nr:hypothetical protein GGF32_008567 [Allomyces javanicus]
MWLNRNYFPQDHETSPFQNFWVLAFVREERKADQVTIATHQGGTDYCLDIEGQKAVQGAIVQWAQWKNPTSPAAKWLLDWEDKRGHQFRNMANDSMCLTPVDAPNADFNGQLLHLWPCRDAPEQQFRLGYWETFYPNFDWDDEQQCKTKGEKCVFRSCSDYRGPDSVRRIGQACDYLGVFAGLACGIDQSFHDANPPDMLPAQLSFSRDEIACLERQKGNEEFCLPQLPRFGPAGHIKSGQVVTAENPLMVGGDYSVTAVAIKIQQSRYCLGVDGQSAVQGASVHDVESPTVRWAIYQTSGQRKSFQSKANKDLCLAAVDEFKLANPEYFYANPERDAEQECKTKGESCVFRSCMDYRGPVLLRWIGQACDYLGVFAGLACGIDRAWSIRPACGCSC